MDNANVGTPDNKIILREAYKSVASRFGFYGGMDMVKINGNQENAAGKTLAEYLETTSFDTRRIAVEINGEIVPKAQYANTLINDGDIIEVVSFVGGG